MSFTKYPNRSDINPGRLTNSYDYAIMTYMDSSGKRVWSEVSPRSTIYLDGYSSFSFYTTSIDGSNKLGIKKIFRDGSEAILYMTSSDAGIWHTYDIEEENLLAMSFQKLSSSYDNAYIYISLLV